MYRIFFTKSLGLGLTVGSKTVRLAKNCGYAVPLPNKEPMNGEFRDREKGARGLKKDDSALINGYQIYHNYIRPHMALDGNTPSEKCGIKIEGNNKWMTLIQNARHDIRRKNTKNV